MNLIGQPATVGRHCGASRYDVTPEVVAFYEDALDDHHPLYERFAPPLLHHSECFRYLGEWYLKNLFGNLHAQQDWECFAPIEVGRAIRTRSTIVDRYAKRGRDYVVNETDYVDAEEGRLLVRSRTHQSFLPPQDAAPDAASGAADAGAGFVVDEDTARRKQREARPPFPTATGEDLPPIAHTIDQRRCWMFSGPGANYHNDEAQARKLGFPRIVVQGMMSTCFVSQLMLARFGEGWLRGGRMSVKLTNVVWCDETVVVRGKVRESVREGTRVRVHCDVWVDKPDGARALIGSASALEA
ncbi:MAG: MaoC family dehydratase [Myxococcota bacterium]